MKTKFKVQSSKFKVGLALLGVLALVRPAVPAELRWDYPPELLSTGLTFRVYYSGSLGVPLTNWTLLATIAGTETRLPITVNTTNCFLVCQVSNVFGSAFSEAILQPAAVVSSGKLHLAP